jgi:hypothetical protein
MPKKFWCILAAFALIIIALPLVIDWYIIGNSFPSNISNSDWVGFLGGYIGAILGTALSMVGIAWTIRFTREQNKADRELQIRPYFDIMYRDVGSFCYTKSWLGYIMISIWDDETDDQDKVGSGNVGAGLLYLKNVGNGPATNISFEINVENIDQSYKTRFTNQNTKVTTNSILSGEGAELSIDITNNRAAPRKEDFIWDDDTPFATYNVTKYKTPSIFSFKITISYSDLLFNRFSQELSFDAQYSMSYKKGEDGKYHCDLHLKEIGVPSKIKQESR